MTKKLVLTIAMVCALVSTAEARTKKKNQQPQRAPAQSESEVRAMCSEESNHRLGKLELRGETRFSDLKFDHATVVSSNVDYAELGGDNHRRRHSRKKEVAPATPQMGSLLTMRAIGKEKSGWRNLIVRCGVNRGRIATFTYEILGVNNAGEFAPMATSASAAPQTN